MAIDDAVELLAMYIEDDGETMRDRFGPQAVAAASDMAAVIAARFGEDSAYAALWDAFEREPDENSEELIGALEAHIEGDPSLARVLDAYLREIRGQMSVQEPAGPAAPRTLTERELAAAGADALDGAVSLDADETEQDRLSYQPGAMDSGVDYDDSVDRGTYIYGEVAAGKDSLGRAAGVERADYAELDARPTELAGLSGTFGLLEALYVAVDDYPDLDDLQKREVLVELKALEQAIQSPPDGEGIRLADRLEKLRTLAPDIAELVIQTLETIDLPPSIQEAVEELRPEPPEEG
jgi:hypothetical protein